MLRLFQKHTSRPQALGLNVNMSLLEKRRMLIAAPDDSDESDDDSDFWEEEEGLVSCICVFITQPMREEGREGEEEGVYVTQGYGRRFDSVVPCFRI